MNKLIVFIVLLLVFSIIACCETTYSTGIRNNYLYNNYHNDTSQRKTITISGQYVGVYTVEYGGSYVKRYGIRTGFNTIASLTITFNMELNITIHYDSSIFDYSYRLLSYYVSGTNYRKDYISKINESAAKLLGTIFYESGTQVNPRIALLVENETVQLKKTSSAGAVTGITLFDDVYCFETKYLYMISTENHSYTDIISQYREIISGTPLYYYELDQSGSGPNYVREKILVINNGIGEKLYKIIVTNSSYILYGVSERIGKIGIIGFNTSSIPISTSIRVNNDTINYSVQSFAPFRVLILLSGDTSVVYSNIPLTKYNATTMVLYVSNIYRQPINVTIKLSRTPVKLFPEASSIGLKGLTVEERGVLTPSDVLIILFANAVLIYLIYYVIKFLYQKLSFIDQV